MSDNCADGTPKGVNILALHLADFETVTLESFSQFVAFKILRRMTSDSDIIVVYDYSWIRM